MLPAHRRYVAVELPFTVSPTTTTTLTLAERGAASAVECAAHTPIAAFLPPAQLQPCLVKEDNNATAAAANDSESDKGEEEQESEVSNGEKKKSNNKVEKDSEDSSDASEEEKDETAMSKSDTAGPALRLRTCDSREYNAEQIFSTWCGTDWGMREAAHGAASNSTGEDEKLLQARRRELFPSTVPQVLLQGYYRNDLLVRVTRRRQLRRLRDPASGAIVFEEELTPTAREGSENEGTKKEDECVEARVVGVVAREVQLARPADWSFALPSPLPPSSPPSHRRAADALLSRDVFPPTHFLSARTPYEVRYALGHERNTAVRPPLDPSSALLTGSEADTMNRSDGNGGAAAEEGAEWTALPSIAVPPDAEALPPAQQAAHKAFLRRVGSSPDGRSPDDPPEVRVLSALLRQRPVWMTKDLAEAQLQSGLCPRPYHNKQLMTCLTYVIGAGAFNRLRIRLDYDPYRDASSVIYQRLPVRLVRRAELGVLLRDASRSPYIEAAVKTILLRHRAHCVEYRQQRREKARRSGGSSEEDAAGGGAAPGTLIELLCRIVRRGSLYIPFQLVDVLDDAVLAEVVARVPSTTAGAPMPRAQRQSRNGWLSETAYLRATTRFTDALQAFLCDEIIPLLRHFAASEDGNAATTAAAAGATQPASTPDKQGFDNDEPSTQTSSSGSGDSAQASLASSIASSDDDGGDDDQTDASA